MKVAVVIPCYGVANSVLDVLTAVPDTVDLVICVDDACPERSGELITNQCSDERVIVIRHDINQGVGGAMVSGYREALNRDAEIIVKLDGDGQMAPADIPRIIQPILQGEADYTKGNRFYLLDNLKGMPRSRLLGNAALSFMSKLSSGYWKNFDPTNGFTAIHRNVLATLPLEQIHRRYFFESDMLYQLSTLRAVAQDVPQRAHYGDETSHLKVASSIPLFLWLHTRNFCRRIFYTYFLRDFHLASIEWILGPALLLFGLIFGTLTWSSNVAQQVQTPIGTVMLATLPIIIGLQLLLSALGFDIDNQPRQPVYPHLNFGQDESLC
jgi:glycosyltransferase involved in cell wall biosynthesis